MNKLELIGAAFRDWRAGILSEVSTLIIIDSLVNPVSPSAEDIEWATRDLNENTSN